MCQKEYKKELQLTRTFCMRKKISMERFFKNKNF